MDAQCVIGSLFKLVIGSWVPDSGPLPVVVIAKATG